MSTTNIPTIVIAVDHRKLEVSFVATRGDGYIIKPIRDAGAQQKPLDPGTLGIGAAVRRKFNTVGFAKVSRVALRALELAAVNPRVAGKRTETFRVASVSSNFNAFGLSGVILVSRQGEAYEVATNTTGPFALLKGADIELPIVRPNVASEARYQWVSTKGRSFEIPRALPPCPKSVVDEIFGA